jgi:hypothetical protein
MNARTAKRSNLLCISAALLCLGIHSGYPSFAGVAPKCSLSGACRRSLSFSNGGRVTALLSFDVEEKQPEILQAVIVIHGLGRNASTAFRNMARGIEMAGASRSTALIAPHFPAKDAPSKSAWEEYWSGGWAMGRSPLDHVSELVHTR